MFPPFSQNAVFTVTLIKSEQIISFKLLLLALEEGWADPVVAGNFQRVALCSPLVRIEGKVRNIPHPQSLQTGLPSQFSNSRQSIEREHWMSEIATNLWACQRP